MRVILICLIIFLLVPTRAEALCLGLRLQAAPSSVTFSGATGEYEVYTPVEHMQSASFKVTSPITAVPCDYFVTMTAGSYGSFAQRKMAKGAARLDYNIYTAASKTAVIKDPGASGEQIAGNFSSSLSSQTNTHHFYWTITPGQVVRGGMPRFQDTVTIKLYAGLLLGIYTQVDTEVMTVQSKVESSIDLSLVNTGSAFNASDTTQTVNFGTLTTGGLQSYDTLVRSNEGYKISVQSQKKQKLEHQSLSSAAIPYSFTFGGAAIDLTGGTAVEAAASSGVTPATGDRFTTNVTIGTVTGGEPPGTYEDVLTVTVTAN